MNTIKRNVVAVIMVCCMCLGLAGAVADVNITSDSGSILVAGHTFELNASTGLVRYDASVTAVSGVSSVYVATVIQRKVNGSWVDVPGSFNSDTQSSNYAIAGGQWYVEKGYWYRTENTFIAYKNGVQTKKVIASDMEWYN